MELLNLFYQKIFGDRGIESWAEIWYNMWRFARTRLRQMKKMIIAAVAGLMLSAGWALNADVYAPEAMDAVRPGGVAGDQQCRYDDWFYPCVLEQYAYYVPIDSANAKMIQMYLAMYRVEKNPLDLAKARALADALVRIQDPNNGYIPTEYAKVAYRHNPQGGWLNCTCLSLKALMELDEIEKKEVAAK